MVFVRKPILMFAAVLSSAPAMAQDISFRSPTGNIHCMIFTGSYTGARCDLSQFKSSYKRPADCDLDFGYAFEVGAQGKGEPLCAGDTVKDPKAVVLDYGHSVSAGGMTCTSAKTGMTCKNRAGHGFTVARAKQKVF
ncbi:hypothetical protein DY251_20730 [Mesorhizobium denitrificans]|uniref:Uncharacterized protein n=1 Tax=Mesorhizobium denitrificans TaxID=2294114 RepID=A0A371X223_9HYPH|nr:hypothetical protein DY251_20730 [Mesorhizobium denitrificans]